MIEALAFTELAVKDIPGRAVGPIRPTPLSATGRSGDRRVLSRCDEARYVPDIMNKRPLPLLEPQRHPSDGWELAEPLPFSPRSQRALLGLVRALLPASPAPRSPGLDLRVVTHVRKMLRYMPPAIRIGYVLALHLLEWSPMWRLRSLSRLSALPADQASDVIRGLANSRLMLLRLLAFGPKATILSTYFDQEEVHDALRYAPTKFLYERMQAREAIEREAELEHGPTWKAPVSPHMG